MEKLQKQPPKGATIIGKEVIIGVLSLTLGGYNLLSQYGIVSQKIETPQIIGNILLVIGGLFLLIQAYKIMRHEYHLRSLF
ncbi:MAG: hypothetical protein ISS25_01830 [Nanoarchaeota archaeon]|nr:hypothetical protein [DPANN group archaeon]MBL7116545.1 hypothetical protein [Nanoarchaeota archaeon]